MATIKKIEDIEVWKLARKLCKQIFEIYKEAPFSKDFSLVNQINSSSGSVMDNIAEGFGRGGNKEFIMFLGYSIGSCNEVKSQLYRAFDRNYIDENTFNILKLKTEEIINKGGALIQYLNKSDFKGPKFNRTKN